MKSNNRNEETNEDDELRASESPSIRQRSRIVMPFEVAAMTPYGNPTDVSKSRMKSSRLLQKAINGSSQTGKGLRSSAEREASRGREKSGPAEAENDGARTLLDSEYRDQRAENREPFLSVLSHRSNVKSGNRSSRRYQIEEEEEQIYDSSA